MEGAQSYSHQDPSAGSPVKCSEGGSPSSGCPDDSVCKDHGPVPPGPGPGCCKTWLEIQREEGFLKPALAHKAGQKDPPSLSIKFLYARDRKAKLQPCWVPPILLFPWDPEYSQSHSLGLSKPSPTLGFGCFVWIHLCIRQWGRVNRRPDWAYWKILPTFGFFLYFSGTVPGKLTYQYPDNLEALRLLAESSPASAKTYFVAFSSRSRQFYTNWYNHGATDRKPRPIHLSQTQQPNQVPNKFPTKH